MRSFRGRAPRSTGTMYFLIAAMGLALVEAAEIRARDGIHRMEKVQAVVTAAPRLDRRAETSCPTSYELCPESLSGGCCQDGYSCGEQSCFATTSGPQTCGGTVGYYACGPDVGGGCCPVGSICRRGSKCDPVSGVSYSHNCPQSFFLCPEDVGYGCCSNGMGCGKNQCFYTTPSTYTYTRTTTSDDVTVTTTVTTTSMPGTPTQTAGAMSDTILIKVYPSTIEKIEPVVSNEEKGGLTKSQLGGVVGGAVVLLLAVVVAAFFIIRRLNKVVEKSVKENGESTSSSKPRPNMQQLAKATSSDTDAASFVPLIHSRNSSRQAGESDTDSPPPNGGGWSQTTNNGYQSVPTYGGDRRNQNSSDSTRTGYFDSASQHSGPRRQSEQSGPGRRSSSDSQGAYGAGPRQRSNTNDTTSDLSAGQQTPQELYAGPVGAELPHYPPNPSRLRSGSGSSLPRPSLTHQRTRSGGSTHTRNDSAAGMGSPPLDVVAELVENHGYYGPETYVGQTVADYPVPKSP